MIQTPHLAVDGIIKLYDYSENFQGLVFIQRLNPPHGIALPGEFVDVGESCEDALVRQIKEEVSLDVEIESLLGIYSDPKRDARFHCASAVYICKAYGVPKAADNAKEVYIYKPENMPLDSLIFDHSMIIQDFLSYFKEPITINETYSFLENVPDFSDQELFCTILQKKNFKIERIVSYGQTTSKDFWYDQDQNEFVIVLQGFAKIAYDDGKTFVLQTGDCLTIQAHQKHQVIYTQNPTIWLAVFFN